MLDMDLSARHTVTCCRASASCMLTLRLDPAAFEMGAGALISVAHLRPGRIKSLAKARAPVSCYSGPSFWEASIV